MNVKSPVRFGKPYAVNNLMCPRPGCEPLISFISADSYAPIPGYVIVPRLEIDAVDKPVDTIHFQNQVTTSVDIPPFFRPTLVLPLSASERVPEFTVFALFVMLTEELNT